MIAELYERAGLADVTIVGREGLYLGKVMACVTALPLLLCSLPCLPPTAPSGTDLRHAGESLQHLISGELVIDGEKVCGFHFILEERDVA